MKTKMIWGQTDFKDVEHSAAHFKYLKFLMSSLPAALWPTVFVHLQYFNMFYSHQVKLYYAGTLLCSAVLESVSRVYILFKISFIFLLWKIHKFDPNPLYICAYYVVFFELNIQCRVCCSVGISEWFQLQVQQLFVTSGWVWLIMFSQHKYRCWLNQLPTQTQKHVTVCGKITVDYRRW